MYVCIRINLRLDLGLNLRSNQRNYSYIIYIYKKERANRVKLARSHCRYLFSLVLLASQFLFYHSFLTFYIFVAVIHQLLHRAVFSRYLTRCHHPSCRFSLCISRTSFALDPSNVYWSSIRFLIEALPTYLVPLLYFPLVGALVFESYILLQFLSYLLYRKTFSWFPFTISFARKSWPRVKAFRISLLLSFSFFTR